VQEPAFVNVKTAATTLFGGGSRTGANQQQPHVRVFIFFLKKKKKCTSSQANFALTSVLAPITLLAHAKQIGKH
jgi:hypothetical protein